MSLSFYTHLNIHLSQDVDGKYNVLLIVYYIERFVCNRSDG